MYFVSETTNSGNHRHGEQQGIRWWPNRSSYWCAIAHCPSPSIGSSSQWHSQSASCPSQSDQFPAEFRCLVLQSLDGNVRSKAVHGSHQIALRHFNSQFQFDAFLQFESIFRCTIRMGMHLPFFHCSLQWSNRQWQSCKCKEAWSQRGKYVALKYWWSGNE